MLIYRYFRHVTLMWQ